MELGNTTNMNNVFQEIWRTVNFNFHHMAHVQHFGSFIPQGSERLQRSVSGYLSSCWRHISFSLHGGNN